MSPSEAAAHFAAMVGATRFTADFGTAKVFVNSDGWVEAHRTLKPHLPYFSWLSAIDWANERAVGDPTETPVVERYEVLSRLGDVKDGTAVILSTDLPKDAARIPTLVGVYGGANWHEREAAEMFGIVFEGHPNTEHLYLPDGFEGFPLRKTFPLLSREVKPWPGTVEVEGMPGETNTEASDVEVEA
ncbi:MAG: NADH-quinone oxidoreductase subunit C [Actinomycetota bacterium]